MVLSQFHDSFLMDVFDERVLSVLKDGKPRLFFELLDLAGFSADTLPKAIKLMEVGFEYHATVEGHQLFRKRK